MEESISMWSIILPVVITAITAYCIYQQNKHYLKVKLALQMVESSFNAMHEVEKQLRSIQNIDFNSTDTIHARPYLATSNAINTFKVEDHLKTLHFQDCLRKAAIDSNTKDSLATGVNGLRKRILQIERLLDKDLGIKKKKLIQQKKELEMTQNSLEIRKIELEMAKIKLDINRIKQNTLAAICLIGSMMKYNYYVNQNILKTKVDVIRPIKLLIQTTLNKIKCYTNKLLIIAFLLLV